MVAMAQFHFDPDSYDEMMASEVPAYRSLQDQVVAASAGRSVRRLLELGTGTGTTTLALLERHPEAEVVGIDESEGMLAAARTRLPESVDLRVSHLQDRLPDGPFDLVVSALAVHHLEGPAKADLFARVAGVLTPRGRFVLGDLVVPDDPADVVTEIDGVFDKPSSIADQMAWMEDAGLMASVAWTERDLAVLVADRR